MAKALVIVESPSKAKIINKYLGSGYKVLASVGHVKDLPKKGIGIDFDNNFEPTYEIFPGKAKVIKELKAAAKEAETIFVATDPDREGEAIGWHIKEELEGRGKDASSYRTHFKRAANLSEYHARTLDNIATQYLSEVQVVDARARQVIESYRAQYPGGKVPKGETPAPPPSELKQLREQRDAITLRYRDSLRSTFGEDEFTNFNTQFVKKRIAPNIRPAGDN